MKSLILKILLITFFSSFAFAAKAEIRDVSWFLKNLRTLDNLPVIENSHTAMISTWDTNGANQDVWTHDNISGITNTIVDIDGPGCLHRMLTGLIDERFSHTRLQLFIDNNKKPVFDELITELFNEETSPLPYPIVFRKTYPGTLMPIPFATNLKVKIVNDYYGTENWTQGMWGVYWQFTYTKYPDDVKIKSLQWPLNNNEKIELERTCKAWLKAESIAPAAPKKWTIKEKATLKPGHSIELNLTNSGVIKQMRIAAWPDTPEILNKLRLQMFWDGCKLPSVDVPIGYLFGHGEIGHNKKLKSYAASMGKVSSSVALEQPAQEEYNTNYKSLLLGITDEECYSKFPMPFSHGAKIKLTNTGSNIAKLVEVKLDVEKRKSIPGNWGRFHVTWSQAKAATEATPKFGLQNIPCKIFLDRKCKGKYVGAMLQVDWNTNLWWGEGDFLIWTDENDWPPSYHGTGSEEYFNAGWGMFDRKAVSGFVALRPGFPTVYSFHLNDAFCFQNNIIVAEEELALPNDMRDFKPMWSSTAFWYAAKPTDAESSNTSLPGQVRNLTTSIPTDLDRGHRILLQRGL